MAFNKPIWMVVAVCILLLTAAARAGAADAVSSTVHTAVGMVMPARLQAGTFAANRKLLWEVKNPFKRDQPSNTKPSNTKAQASRNQWTWCQKNGKWERCYG